MHQADAVFQRGAEQRAAETLVDFLAIELDRHDIRMSGHFLEPRSERVPEFAIINVSGSTAEFIVARKIQVILFQ